MHREKSVSRQQSSTDPSDVGSAADLQPCREPAAELQRAIAVLNTSNAASRLDLDWQAQLQVGYCLPNEPSLCCM